MRRIIYDCRRYITLRFSRRRGVSSALFISPHFLLHFFLQFHFNSHLLQFLSHFSGVIGWERCTSTSKTKAAPLFCRRGGRTDREKDGRRWRKGKMERVEVGGRRCGGRMFQKLSCASQWVKTSQVHPAEKVPLDGATGQQHPHEFAQTASKALKTRQQQPLHWISSSLNIVSH